MLILNPESESSTPSMQKAGVMRAEHPSREERGFLKPGLHFNSFTIKYNKSVIVSF